MQIGVESARAVENRRIFVVDTDEIIRAALQFMLHDENEAHELESVEAALVKATDWPPDLILLGQSLLQSEGLAALTRLTTALQEYPRPELIGTESLRVFPGSPFDQELACLSP